MGMQCNNTGPTREFGRLLGEGARGERGGMWYRLVWRAGAGETMGATEMFFLSMCCACEYAHEFGKKNQGKICVMQSHGQSMPPCDCIAKIAAEECQSC